MATPQPEQRALEPIYRLLVGTQAVPVDLGETILGRGEECRIVVLHSSVSRRHARLILEGTRLSIEDLGSANGTYVNRARIYGPTLLERGDWIALGGFEIEVLKQVSSDPDAEGEDRPTPISGVAVIGQIRLSRSEASIRGAETDRHPRAPIAGHEELDAATRLVDRMLAAGRVQAAEQILTTPVASILEAALAGTLPDTSTVDALGRSALKLANATGDGGWVDAAIELHLLAMRPLRLETIRQLAMLRSRIHIGDDTLIARYCETLRSRIGAMSPGERNLVELAADLLAGPERNH